jgi:predicted ArsR family transcriptional regulator
MIMPNGLDAKEISEILGINQRAVKKRLERAGVKPLSYSGPTAIYAPEAVDAIKDSRGRGRPPKKPAPDDK